MNTAPLRLIIVTALTIYIAMRVMGWLDTRSEPVSKRVGTGTVTGVVVDDRGERLAGAHVFITEEDAQLPWTATAGPDGAFRLERLPAGTFQLGAAKEGHLAAYFVQAPPRWGVTRITLSDGGSHSGVEIRVPRAASIEGVVEGADGLPLVDHEVRVRAIGRTTGEAIVAGTVGVARTDTHGRYKVDHLDAGTYAIVVRPRNQQRRVLYYPGAWKLSAAGTLTLARGERRTGIDIQPQAQRGSTVEGRLTVSGGPPPSRVDVSVFDANATLPLGEDRTVETNADGRFVIEDLPAGEFILAAQVSIRPSGAAARDALQVTRLSGIVTVRTDGRTTVPATLNLAPGVPVSGRILRPQLADDVAEETQLTVRLSGATPISRARLGFAGAETRVAPDGSFTLMYVPPGEFTFVVSDHLIQSATLNELDVTTTPLRIESSEMNGLTLAVTGRTGEVAGTVRDAAGAMTGQGVVLLYPADARLWRDWHGRVQAQRPDSSGRFRFDHLGAGDYLIAALADVGYGDWDDVEFLEKLRMQATALRLPEAGQETVDLISLQTFNKSERD